MMIEEKKKAEKIKKLNAGGDDRSLVEDGNNRHYWYSINDIMTLLIHTRKGVLQYSNEVQPGEEFIAIRQNQPGVFLADPYHVTNFSDYLNDDISRIIGNHSEEAQNSHAWHNMPTLIVIPLLSGMHWRTIAIQINYESNNIDVVWDDPYGNFPEQLKQLLLESIKVNVLRLLNSNNQIINEAEVANELTEETINILQHNNAVDQQGNGQNGWDCGPITVSNIKDYISHYVSNNNLTEINYTVGSHDRENHDDSIKDIRINHIDQYGEVAEIEVDAERLNNIRLTWESNNKTQLERIEEKFNKAISQLDDFYLSMFFTVLENYQQFTQKENDEKTIEYALNLVQTERTKEIIQIKSQISNNLLEEVAFFVLLPTATKFFLLPKILTNIKDGEQQYQNFMKSFGQSPKDKDSYKKSIEVIKSKLLDNLYKNFADEIDYLFTNKFVQKVKPYIEFIQQKEMVKNIESDLGSIAFQLIKKKEKEEPQIELLKQYLLEKAEELNLKEDFKIEKLKKSGHANDVYLVSNTKIDQDDPSSIDYYAKSFSQDERTYAKNGLIDPNELFIYKILEYTGFGPECWFLMKTASSSHGTISRGNFILTRNLGKGEGVNFLLDDEENKEVFGDILSNSKKFAIEISAAAAINDIVALWDTFKNSGNYGVVFYNNSLENLVDSIAKNEQKEESKKTDITEIEDYKIVFIDHLPNAGNGILSQLHSYKVKSDERYNSTTYSPRESIISSHKHKPNKFIDLAKISKEIGFSKAKIINDVYKKLSDDELDYQQWNKFKKALEKAKEYVETIIKEYSVNFYSEKEQTAFNILEDYYKKILSNLEIFDEKYKENIDQDSYGIQYSGDGMSDKDISLNLQSLKYNIEANNKKLLFWIEQDALNQRNMIDKIESWSNANTQSEFLSIVTIINSEGKKHAILLHATHKNDGIQITLIDPLSQQDSEFSVQINALKNTLSNQKQHHVQIIYAGCQDKDHGTCGDMSLIMLQEVIEQASNKPTVSINNQIAVNIADTDQTNYENSIFHNIEYDNLQIEVVGDINYFH